MAPDAKGTPSLRTGGSDARAIYDTLTDDLLYDPAIGRATMMGYPCVRLAGRFLASYDEKAGSLVVKLPHDRVTELVENGSGDPFAPAGKVFRDGSRSPPSTEPDSDTLLDEAVDLALQGRRPTSAPAWPGPPPDASPQPQSPPATARRRWPRLCRPAGSRQARKQPVTREQRSGSARYWRLSALR